MLLTCKICTNPQIAAITADLCSGESVSATARKYNVNRSTLYWHKLGHSHVKDPEKNKAYREKNSLQAKARNLNMKIVPDKPDSAVKTVEIINDIKSLRQSLDGEELLQDSEFADLYKRIKEMYLVLQHLLEKGLAEDASNTQILAIVEQVRKYMNEERQLIETVSPLRQKQPTNVTVYITPVVNEIKAIILETLDDYPDASKALSTRLAGLLPN